MQVSRILDYGDKVVVCFTDGHREGFPLEKRTEARARVREVGWDKSVDWWRYTETGSVRLLSVDEGLELSSSEAAAPKATGQRKGRKR